MTNVLLSNSIRTRLLRLLAAWLVIASAQCAVAQHSHGHNAQSAKPKTPPKKPRVFLDKSPRVVAYQLKRLSNERLLLVDRGTDDAKYLPVHQAILVRSGMSPQYRSEALLAMAAINQSSAASEALQAIEGLDIEDRQQLRSAKALARVLLARPVAELQAEAKDYQQAVTSSHALVRATGFAGLVQAGQAEQAEQLATNDSLQQALLSALELVPGSEQRNSLRTAAVQWLQSDSVPTQQAAARALRHIRTRQTDTFRRLAPLVSRQRLRTPAIQTLLAIPGKQRDAESARPLVTYLVELAEKTPAAKRTADDFMDAMQLADQLLGLLPTDDARSLRQRLSQVAVRVVQIKTINEEMRYDTPYFAVAAGRPVQVVLKNEDLMPHNLVFTQPGALQEVAELGLAVGPKGGKKSGKQYVPDSELVLFASDMIGPGEQERLTFTAPTEPGEYTYVCTFPRHWMRMYGVMVVVEDLDAWLAKPTAPADPLGSTRAFVQSWTVDDFAELAAADKANANAEPIAEPEAGHRLFVEATCVQCHQANGVGGAVGPALNGVFARWKGDAHAVLREILDPSHRIDDKYAVHLAITVDGQSHSGIVAKEDKKSISLLLNPESDQLTVLQRDDIDELVKTSTSMMPKGLLDRYSREEVLELLGYLRSLK